MDRTLRVDVTAEDLTGGDYKAVAAAIARVVGMPCRVEVDPCDVDVKFDGTRGVTLTWSFRTPDVVARKLYHVDHDAGKPYAFDVLIPGRMSAFLAAGEAGRE